MNGTKIMLRYGMLCGVLLWVFTGVYANPPTEVFDSITRNPQMDFDLLGAVYNQDAEMINLLIIAGADPNAQDVSGFSALMFAVSTGNEAIVDYLLDQGANPDATDESGYNALIYSILYDHSHIFFRLLPITHNVDHQNNEGHTALFLVAQSGDTSMAQALIDQGSDLHLQDEAGMQALHHAVAFGHFYMTDMLIFYGADVNARDHGGATPLHLAAFYGQDEIAGLLMEMGGQPNPKDKQGNTPLMAATANYQLQTVWYLIESGADLSVHNDEGHTALSLAMTLGDDQILDLILSYDFVDYPSSEKMQNALAEAYHQKNRDLVNRMIAIPGVDPRGLYFSEISALSGLEFNDNELMYVFQVGAFESRYRLNISASFKRRAGTKKVVVLQDDYLKYRFLEKRHIASLNLQREIILRRWNRKEWGVMPGAGLLYSWADYNGTSIEPPSGIAVKPVLDMYYRYGNFRITGGYNFFRTGQTSVPAHRLNISVGYSFSLPGAKRPAVFEPVW